MYTLSREEDRNVRGEEPTLEYPDDPLCLSWSGLKVLDMTHVRESYGHLKTIDLSGNLFISLPKSFARSLRHCEYLDLSRNRLESLPKNFGLLDNLHTLILYLNKLETLPVSFRKLKNLRWLDIAANPLEPRLLEICGDDFTRCEVVARNIIEFMHDLYNAQEADVRIPDLKLVQARRANLQRDEPTTTDNEINQLSESEFIFTPTITECDSMTEAEHETTITSRQNFHAKNYYKTSNHTNEHENAKSEVSSMYEKVASQTAPLLLKVLYGLFIFIGLFALVCFSLSLYYQGPPEELLSHGEKLYKYELVPDVFVHSAAWAVHICPTCVPYRNAALAKIVVPRRPFLMNFLSLFFAL